ncbi:MAG: tetratricopeptide repeat-containing glycosyltransferase family protein [Planctomycetaceae bacterium]|jgi:tetratricopeptide (TPR) repeat protein|nr:tetratricopeptide repeat-containing glycosyltransferase family protein [Planctomycetaceae bacterium]
MFSGEIHHEVPSASPEEVLQILTEAERMAPNDPQVLLPLGQLHFSLEHYAEAADKFRKLSAVQPENPSVWLTLGFIFSEHLHQYEKAAEFLKTADSLDKITPEIPMYLAESLRKAERYEESVPYYQRLLPVGLEYPQAIHGYGKTLLALGRLAEGWEAMEFRLAASLGNWERHHLPVWAFADGKPYKTGRENSFSSAASVLAYSEEGIGAELMFASCLPDLIDTVDHCVVECEGSLHDLFKRSFPRAVFVPLADDYVEPDKNPWGLKLDSQIAFGSLPRHFRQQISDFPLRKAYLVPDRNLVEKWSNRLAELGDARKIGILWQGMWTDESVPQTSLPVREIAAMMRRHPEAAWVNLQHGQHQNDLAAAGGFRTASAACLPHFFPDAFKYNLDSMAALLTALDLVITPPGYIAHLAGALGVRTWLLLPERADWRHNIGAACGGSLSADQTNSLWHPAVRVYRQPRGSGWQTFFAPIEEDLQKYLTTRRPPEKMVIPMPQTLAFPHRRVA